MKKFFVTVSTAEGVASETFCGAINACKAFELAVWAIAGRKDNVRKMACEMDVRSVYAATGYDSDANKWRVEIMRKS